MDDRRTIAADLVQDRSEGMRSADGIEADDFFQPVCVICQEALVGDNGGLIRTFRCGHKFHQHCVSTGNLRTCPLCREVLTDQKLCVRCYDPITMTYQFGNTVHTLCSLCMINKIQDESRHKAKMLMVYNKNIANLEYNTSKIFARLDEGVPVSDCMGQLILELQSFYRGADQIHMELI